MDFGYKPQGDINIGRGFMAKINRVSINESELVLSRQNSKKTQKSQKSFEISSIGIFDLPSFYW
jgi:hypothetical protein